MTEFINFLNKIYRDIEVCSQQFTTITKNKQFLLLIYLIVLITEV